MQRLAQLTPGSTFAGEFRVVRPLAQGGMGAVYEVEQLRTGAARALKIMHPQLVFDAKLQARFVQEARVSALIKSDHVVQVVGAGVDAETGIPWLAMELLEGETLGSFLARRGALSLVELREVFAQLCHALAAAHDVGVVHRDLKPENVFLGVARREGASFTVKILDFGIAKLVAEAHTNHTAAIGTPLWMAPEQTELGAVVCPATDVWALGLLAFHALTGAHYWRVASSEQLSAAALLREIVLEPLASASERAAAYGRADRIPPGFDAWFSRCVVREMDRRFPNARDARDALAAVIGASSSASLGVISSPSLVAIPAPSSRGPHDAGDARADALVHGATELATPVARADDDGDDAPVPVRPFPRAVVAAVALVALVGVGLGARAMRSGSSSGSAGTVSSSDGGPASGGAAPFALEAPPPKTCPPGMASIGGGSFFMGSKGDHVTVAPFCLDATEVRVADYADCVAKGLCTDTGLASGAACNWSTRATKGKHPINCVDWDQAAAYCHAEAKRLPTVAEWEWAARGGEAGTTYPWGEDAPGAQLCWSGVLPRIGTCEVGSHPSGAGRLGVLDLGGNVAEWVVGGTETDESARPVVGDHWQTKSASFTKDLSGRTSVATRFVSRSLREPTVGLRCAQ